MTTKHIHASVVALSPASEVHATAKIILRARGEVTAPPSGTK